MRTRIRALTGLPIDAYFSGTKVGHILDSSPDLRARAEAGDLCFGTIDTFLLWRLSGGRVHATDVSNASRTLLFDISRLAWDPWLCEVMGVPMAMLPGGAAVVRLRRRDRSGRPRCGRAGDRPRG